LSIAFVYSFRYTGYIPAVKEVVENTPVLTQEEAFRPTENTFLYERNKPPVDDQRYNYCNDPSIYKKGLPIGQAANLWPNKQDNPRPQSATDCRPQEDHIVHGDRRIRVGRSLPLEQPPLAALFFENIVTKMMRIRRVWCL
jgi:hypothetical protein